MTSLSGCSIRATRWGKVTVMGANAQTTVQKFLSGAVLTAEQQNFSAATGVPVFATTVTRDAAFGGANKVLAEGQTCYLEDANVVQYYDGAAWATVGPAAAGALTLITAQTIGNAVSSVAVASCFSATYDNYKITVSDGAGSVNDERLKMILGSTTSGYYATYLGTTYSSAAFDAITDNNAAAWSRVGGVYTNGLQVNFDLQNPNLAKITNIMGFHVLSTAARVFAGILNNTTQYTGFTLSPLSGTLTGGVIRVYGYANS